MVCANIPGDAEDEALGVSTDEDSIAVSSYPPPAAKVAAAPVALNTYLPPIEPETLERFARTARVSIDAYEREREQARLAKATECQNNRRRMSYDRVAREEALALMKLPNQLMWSCRDCQVSSAKPGMEKHLMLKTHWERVLENYSRSLAVYNPNLQQHPPLLH